MLFILYNSCSAPKPRAKIFIPNSPGKASRPTGYLEKTYVPEKSISNVDLTDNENNGLDETFGKMHDKVHSLGNSNDFGDYGFAGYKSLPYALPKTGQVMQNRHKYNRAYLTKGQINSKAKNSILHELL